jgi:glycosyltransferase involved in cell wall biosynthesis
LAIGDVDEHIGRRVRELCDTMGLGGAFFILGFRDDVPNVLAALDLFALSSSAEGFSIATIEAMAAGRPVVVTRSGGPQEIIEHGRTGLLVDPNDPHSMAESIVFLLRHPERAQKMAMDARADVEAKFSLEKMVKEYEAIYLRLTSGANGRRPGLSRSFS